MTPPTHFLHSVARMIPRAPGVLMALLCVAMVPRAAAADPGVRMLSPLAAPIAASAPRVSQTGGEAPTGARWWSRLYADGYYDTRWDGWFAQTFFQQGYRLPADSRFSVYGIAALTADSRSDGSGPLPAIISDNILLLGAGVRFRPAQSFWIDAQEGVAFDLVDRNGSRASRGDFRLVATGGTGVYPEFNVHPEFRSPGTLMADCFLSAGYYSRYRNGIGYAQGRLGARVGEVSRAFLDVYLRGDVALDTEGKFYNNTLEIGPGLRFTPDPEWGLFLIVEYRRGFYAGYTDAMRARRAAFYPAQYDAVRLHLVLDREF